MNIKPLIKSYTYWPEINNIFHKNIDFSKTSVSELESNFKDVKSDKLIYIEQSIFLFYAYNEYISFMRNKEDGFLGKNELEIFKEYQSFLDKFSKQMFAYIFNCCLAEARHSNYLDDELILKIVIEMECLNGEKYKKDMEGTGYKSLKSYLENEVFYFASDIPKGFVKNLDASMITNKLIKKYKNSITPNGFKDFLEVIAELFKIQKGFEDENGELQNKLLETLADEKFENKTVGDILEGLTYFFKKGFEDGYGGEAWSKVAKHALSFAKGEINAEAFIDQALSLEHNNGHIFNKNFIFDYHDGSINGGVYDYGFYLSLKDILFNLQNSSSVFAFLKFQNDKVKKSVVTKKTKEQEIGIYHINKFVKFQNHFNNEVTKWKNKILTKDILNTKLLKNIKENNFVFKEFDMKGFYTSVMKSQNTPKHLIEKLLAFEPYFNNNEKITYNVGSVFEYYNLNNKNSKKLSIDEIGGKAKGLVELMDLGFNVPKAMVFTTKTCLSYLNNKKNFQKEFVKIKKSFKEYLKDNDGTPILVSVRSGASISMPGMMDTVLNVGIDDSTYDLLCKKYDKKLVDKCSIAFMEQFCSSKLEININLGSKLESALKIFKNILKNNNIKINDGMFPLNNENQIQLCIEAVFDSWNSPRAIAWRKEKGISNDLGTAATIQKMALGNKLNTDLTCVVFSRNCITGEKELMGEYLTNAQGEDLVSGKKTPVDLKYLEKENFKIYTEIKDIANKLENHYKKVQDIEITVEDGIVYVLQKRNAVISQDANIKICQEFGQPIINEINIETLVKTEEVNTLEKSKFSGLSANGGVICGVVVNKYDDLERYKHLNKPFVFFTDQALPEHAPMMIGTQAFVTKSGGATSHAAVLARSMNKPCVVGIGSVNLKVGSIVTIDAYNGHIWDKEIPIKNNVEKANKIAKTILKENNIKNVNKLVFNSYSYDAWFNKLNKSKMISKNNHEQFLSSYQKVAAILIKQTQKQIKGKKNGIK